MTTTAIDEGYEFDDRFDLESHRLYLTGWDALVRLNLMRAELDRRGGLNTAGFVSGYPGSPLGGLDSLFRAQRTSLASHDIHFEPGLNEDLAATAVWGSQNLNNGPFTSRYDGVFGMWYGKGPGVERSTDAMRTGSYQGVAANGGVLALAGDDHDARSTVTAQQSDLLFVHMHMPVMNPSSVQEYVDFGLAGWALSRFCSSWVGFICLNDIADSAATVDVDLTRYEFVDPTGVTRPPALGAPRRPSAGVGGAAGIEKEIREIRLPAAQAWVRANALDRVVLDGRGKSKHTTAIVTSGKAYLDVIDAFARMGLTLEAAADLGLSVYKLAVTWPLEPVGMLEFLDGHDEVLVVEPKHPVIEDQLNRLLWRLPSDRRPTLVGKTDENGAALVPSYGALDAVIVSRVLLSRLRQALPDHEWIRRFRPRESLATLGLSPTTSAGSVGLIRAAGFCSGCPHNISTKIPDGSVALGGTGCHGMALSLTVPERATHTFTHMGGEGALWTGMAPFTEQDHMFQNMGDGTYAHSGHLSIRASVAANVNITYKILLNGYISMTGGQAIPGGLSAQDLARRVVAEGVSRVAVVSDDPRQYRKRDRFPRGTTVHHRDELIGVERELQALPGVTVLIYDQACAAELRRERRRGRAPDPDKRVFINEAVCEGCGDCNIQSNCIAVEPVETDLGRKRQINQSSCNKDFSCLAGYCPSFVTVYGAKPRKASPIQDAEAHRLRESIPVPSVRSAPESVDIVVGGIGGGGVLTVGALIGMAAHLEGKTASVLNETGLAQKNGTVQSHVRVCDSPGRELSPRVADGSADLIVGADMVVVSSTPLLATMDPDRTVAIVNSDVRPTVAFAGDRDLDFSSQGMVATLERATGGRLRMIDANALATRLMGDSVYMNVLLLGYCAQQGLLPVSVAALERAIELNGVSVEPNRQALLWGRLAAHDHEAVTFAMGDVRTSTVPDEEPVEHLVERRRSMLAEYQDEKYAHRFGEVIAEVMLAERRVNGAPGALSRAAADSLSKLMAYKDEYEVARLYVHPAFRKQMRETFEGGFRYRVNLAPQVFNRRDSASGRARKWALPSWLVMPVFALLARARRLRGTPLDLFGMTEHRKAERQRVHDYIDVLGEIARLLDSGNVDLCVQIAALPQSIKGYDTIKDAAAAQAKTQERTLMRRLRETAATSAQR